MSLRGRPVEQQATLPDGRTALVRVGVPDDPYIPRAELDTVALEVWIDERVAATLNTVLDVDQDREARALARDVVARLESGDLEPTAGALEPLADQLR
jgi:hypothetical protein